MQIPKTINQSTMMLTAAALASAVFASGCCSKAHSQAAYRYHGAPAGYSRVSTAPAPAPAPVQQPPQAMEANGNNIVIPLYQETVNVGKREVNAGAVRLRKVVKSETVNQPVQLRHEELVIDRVPAATGAAQGQNFGQPFQEQETVIRLQNELPVVEKQMTPAGSVVVQKRETGFQTNIQAQVRREDVDIVKMGNPQNVIIGQNLRSSTEPGEASGGAGDVGGQSAGGASSVGSGAITDPMMLTTSPDAAAFNGRQVQFSGVRVQRVLGDRLLMLSTDNGKPFYVLSDQRAADLNAGDIVNLTGTIRQTPRSASDLGLSDDAAQALSGQPLYIDSAKIEPTK